MSALATNVAIQDRRDGQFPVNPPGPNPPPAPANRGPVVLLANAEDQTLVNQLRNDIKELNEQLMSAGGRTIRIGVRRSTTCSRANTPCWSVSRTLILGSCTLSSQPSSGVSSARKSGGGRDRPDAVDRPGGCTGCTLPADPGADVGHARRHGLSPVPAGPLDEPRRRTDDLSARPRRIVQGRAGRPTSLRLAPVRAR